MEEDNSSANASRRGEKFPIAIVGIGCRMPGGVTSPEEFWDVLVKGRDMVTEIPPDRWSIESFYHKNQSVHSKMVTKRCGFIKDIDKFDNSFFQISPREAASMDPQQRHMLEVAYEAFQDAGIIPSSCQDCGVYVAVGRMDYPIMIMDTSITNAYTLTGTAHSVVANRISYVFNFKGPSMVVDTACASSFTAMHLGCSSLWNGECNIVLAGGANPVIIPEVTVGYSALGVLSPEGMSCPFSDTAKGYVRSEGWGAFVLKPLDAALRDSDHVYAVIRGSAVACNGTSKSLTMPCSETQKMVMRMAYDKFDIPMSSVQFVEAHGTGTPVGDPIEARAIGETFGALNKEPIKIGSVKSNFGHTECASGVTSGIKVALMLEKKQLVPSVNFRNINPSIDLNRLNIRVQTCNESIEDGERPYRVGLNSFGFAGAVAHMIFEEAPKKGSAAELPTAGWKLGEEQPQTGKYVIMPLSAKSPEAVNDLARKWENFSSEVDALQIASWQATRREHHTCKIAIVANSAESFRTTVTSFLQGETKEALLKSDDVAHTNPKICFVFPGQGQQWYNMGRQLYLNQTVFRDTINECDSIFTELSGWSLVQKTGVFNGVSASVAPEIIEQVEILQPTIHFFQIALFNLWKHWGVRPDFVVGHSLGEIAAAYAAGALSLKEAISVVYYRAAQQATLSGTGAMAAVRSNRETAEALCKSYPDVYIAAVNGPGSVTISGDCNHIASIVKNNAEKAKQLRVSAAYHTSFMSLVEDEFRKSMAGVITSDGSNRSAAFYSTVTGECYKGALDVDYWWQNIRRPVMFQPAIESVLNDTDVSIFLEVSATATLRPDVQKIVHFNDPLRQMSVVVSGRRNHDDQMYALLALGNLYTLGVNIDWREVTHNAARWAPIPTYPWQHNQSLWIEAEDHQKIRLGLDDRTFKGKNGYITTDAFAFLSEYFEYDVLVFPSAGFLKYTSEIVFSNEKAALEKVQFVKPLTWTTDSSNRQNALKLDSKRVGFQIEIKEKETTYFKATISDIDEVAIAKEEEEFDLDDVLESCGTYLSQEDFYHQLQVTGITNGEVLQVVEEAYLGDSESVTYINVDAIANKQHAFLAALNAVLQAPSVAVQQPTIKYRPVGLEAITLLPDFFAGTESSMTIYTDVTDCDGHFLMSNLLILSESGSVLGIIKNLECHNVDKKASTIDIEKCLFTTQWQPFEACNLSIAAVLETFDEPQITVICGKDVNALKRAEEVADDIENICVSYISHAFDTVPDVERAKGKRYHKYMAIFDAVQTRYTGEITPYDNIPDLMGKVLHHCPELDVEMHLAKRLGEALPDTLRNPHTCVPIMFSPDCLDRYFWDGLSMKLYYEATANAIVRSVKNALKTKQVVRVLELGGRLGGFTRFVLEPLKQYGMANRLEYVFTDVSATFFSRAKGNLQGYSFVQYKVLSVDKNAVDQGFVPSSFDIVVCVDTLHVAIDARRSTRYMNDLLLPKGHLYILEGTNTHFLTELWFGTMDVCLVFEDERTKILNKSCWFHREGWMQVMRDVGLADVGSASSPNEFYHSVTVGRKPALDYKKPNTGEEEQNRDSIFIFEDDTKAPHHHQQRRNTANLNTTTLGQEIANALTDTVGVESFSGTKQFSSKLKRIEQPCEVVYVHGEREDDVGTLFEFMQVAGAFPRKLHRVWVVVRTKEKQLTPSIGSALGLVQALSNRAKSVSLYSLHVAATGFKTVAQQFAMLRRQNRIAEHHFFMSKDGSLEVPRVMNHHVELIETEAPEHWMAKFLTETESTDNLDKLEFFSVDEMPVSSGDVKIRIESIPLSGTDSDEIQCIGTVETIGDNDDMDSGVHVGDEVIGFGQIPLASHAICDKSLVIPNTYDVDSCGLVPLASAYYSLVKRAKVTANETVLICSDNITLCLAAIQVAKHIRCRVICIAVDFQNESFLMGQLGVAKVIQMTSSILTESILRWTNNNGVDVVFLSSHAPNYEKILSVVSHDGRICEVSRNNVLQMSGITSNALMGNKVFHACQIDILLRHQPQRFRDLILEVMSLLKRNRIDPVPKVECPIEDFLTSYDVNKSSQAEQVVLEIPHEFNPLDHVELHPSTEQFSAEVSYIVTAAHTNVALAFARWLYQNGARSVVLISHQDLPTASKQTQKFLRNHKVEVRECIVDLSDESKTSEVLNDIRASCTKPIKGVFHLDSIIHDDKPFEIEAEEAGTVLRNAVARAHNLHALTKRDNLDIFVTLSSINALVGVPSKPLSSAISAYLDGLAEQRNAQGLPALSVQVGPVRCMGMVYGITEAESYQMNYDRRQQIVHVDDFLQALGLLLRKSDRPVVCFGNQDWASTKQMCVHSSSKFRHLAKDAKVVKEKPRSATMNKRQIEHVIKSKMAELLCMRKDAIDVKRPMTAYGVDSLIAMEIANWASDPSQLGLVISQFDILDGMTIATLLHKAIGS